MDFHGIRVLLLDGFCRQIAILLKEMHDLGCVVTTLCASKLDVGYVSRYPAKRIVDRRFHGDIAYYRDLIFQLAQSWKYDVIFPVIEESTEICAKERRALEKNVKVVAPPLEAFKKAHDKQLTMMLCMENGIPCPRTKRDDETLDAFLADVHYPLALKPRQGRGSVGFKKVDSRKELDDLLDSGEVRMNEYVIQEFVAQAETHRVSYTVIDQNDRVVSSMIAKSTRPYPLVVGTNSLFESVQMPEVAEQAERLLQLMGWQGYASVCFIESDMDRTPKVMEINGRISASFKISVLAGLPIVRQLLEMAYGEAVTPMPSVLKYGMRVAHTQSSFMWFVKSKDRFRKEERESPGVHTRDIVFSVKDPLPWISYSLQCLGKYRSEMGKRKRQ